MVKQESFKLTDPPKTTINGVTAQTPALHDTFNPAGKVANVSSCWLPLSRHSYAVLADIFTVQFYISKQHLNPTSLRFLCGQILLRQKKKKKEEKENLTSKSRIQPLSKGLVLTEPWG